MQSLSLSISTLILVILLTGCQMLPATDPASIRFNIPKLSTLTLNKELPINKGHTHVVIQDGRIVSEKTKDLYNISCSFEMKAFGPRTIYPDTFQITRVEDGQERVSTPNLIAYYTEVYLHSEHNSDIIKLVCTTWGDAADGSFPVADMQKALGDYFSFTFAKTN